MNLPRYILFLAIGLLLAVHASSSEREALADTDSSEDAVQELRPAASPQPEDRGAVAIPSTGSPDFSILPCGIVGDVILLGGLIITMITPETREIVIGRGETFLASPLDYFNLSISSLFITLLLMSIIIRLETYFFHRQR